MPPVPGAATVPAAPGVAPANEAARAEDDTFLLLREAARQNDSARANALSSRLPNYVLAPYVDYYRLKPRLREASADEIRAVLQRHQGTAAADRLRTDWLLELGRARDWTNFDRELAQAARSDDLQVRCYALLARAARGERVIDEARTLLVNPPAYGEGCAALMAQLAQAGQLTQDELLAQLRLAGEMTRHRPLAPHRAAARRFRHPRRASGRRAGRRHGARHRRHPRRTRNLPGRAGTHGAHQPQAGHRRPR